jgi:hypothetical protein
MTERVEKQPAGTERIATMDLPATPSHGLMPAENEDAFRSRWTSIQTGFVDEPSRSVKEADELVAEVMKRLAEGFAQERSRLEEQWAREKEVSTEDLRVVLQRYRSFFDRLLGSGVPRRA